MSERELRELEWLRREAALSRGLSDSERTAVLSDLLKTADAIRDSKSAQEKRADEEARRREDEPGKARYRSLVERIYRPSLPGTE